jgi:hypothetical protein
VADDILDLETAKRRIAELKTALAGALDVARDFKDRADSKLQDKLNGFARIQNAQNVLDSDDTPPPAAPVAWPPDIDSV